MFQNLSVAWKIATAPVWLGWRAYQGLWWAFDDVPRVKSPGKGMQQDPGAASAPGASVQVGGASDAKAVPVLRAKPIKELKIGFMSSTILWFPAGYLATLMHNMGWISESGAVLGTLWAMAVLWVGSLFMVRRQVMKTPVKRTPLEAAKAAVAAVKDAPRTVAARAAGTVRDFASRGAGLSDFARAALARVKGAAAGIVPSKVRAPATGTSNGQALKF